MSDEGDADLRLRAERLARRSQIVAEVARELARVGLRAGPVLDALARRVAEALQGSCIVTVQAEDTGALEVVASHDPEPEADALLRTLVAGAVAPAVDGSPVTRAFDEGEATLFATVTPEQLDTVVRSRPALAPYFARLGLSSFVIAPLRVPERVLGTISCARRAGAPPLTPDDLAFLSKLADLASLALENARLHGLAEDAAARSQVVAELSHALAGTGLEPLAVLRKVARRVSDVLRACAVVRLLPVEGDGPLAPLAWHAPTDDACAHLARLAPRFEGPCAREAFGGDGPLLFGPPDGDEVARLRALGLPWLAEQEGVTAIMVAPLVRRGELTGTVVVWRGPAGRPFLPRDAEFVQKTADVAALALENVRLRRAADAERAHLVAVLQQLPVGVAITDPAGRLAMANEQTGLILGRSPTAGEVVEAGFGGEGEGPLARALRKGDVVKDEEAEVARPDGRRGALLVSAAPVREPDGRVVAGVLTLADVTEARAAERRLRDTHETLQALITGSPLAIMLLDRHGRVRLWNQAAEQVFGWTADEVHDRPLPGVPDEHRSQFEASLARVLGGEPLIGAEAVRRRKDGSTIEVQLWAAAVPSGNCHPCCLAIVADVSERARLERELRRRAEELAEAHERKDQFLAMLAHELRAPLAPILTATHLLQHPGATAKGLERAAGVIDRQVHHLARLVDDLLEVSRITRGKIRMERQVTDAAAVVARALETSRPAIQAKGHALEVVLAPERLPLEADPVRLSQVLSNLLQNAAKYTDPGGRITLGARREGHEVVFSVVDNGIGIPKEKLDSIFELFAQVDQSLDRSQGGLGIGLTLARALVELHGGTILARSQGLGRGAELSVRLPVYEPRSVQPEDPDGGGAEPAARPRRVLVVDDSRDAVEMLSDLLGSWGHDVVIASDGVEALERAAAFAPEVVLLDIGLPRLDGYEVARRLRSARVEPAPLLVAVTGYGQEDDRRRASDAGFDGLLVKPVAVRDLRDVIDRGISNRRTSGRQRRSSP